MLDVFKKVAIAMVVIIPALIFYPKECPTRELFFGNISITADIASTANARAQGLSGRESLEQNMGMLFVFPREDRYSFWMKDMKFPIDILWLNGKKKIVSISMALSPASYPTIFTPPTSVRYVLETNVGWADDHALALGSLMEIGKCLDKRK